MAIILVIIAVLIVFAGMWAVEKRRDYSPSPSQAPEEHFEVCETCGHQFDADTGKLLNWGQWFCKEHTPKYDRFDDVGRDREGKQLRRYWRNYVECDENGVIKKEAINPK